MNAPEKITWKDFETDQEVRWCPGCGDYAILKAVQRTMPDLGVPKENIVFVSGIGCSSRFPYFTGKTEGTAHRNSSTTPCSGVVGMGGLGWGGRGGALPPPSPRQKKKKCGLRPPG